MTPRRLRRPSSICVSVCRDAVSQSRRNGSRGDAARRCPSSLFVAADTRRIGERIVRRPGRSPACPPGCPAPGASSAVGPHRACPSLPVACSCRASGRREARPSRVLADPGTALVHLLSGSDCSCVRPASGGGEAGNLPDDLRPRETEALNVSSRSGRIRRRSRPHSERPAPLWGRAACLGAATLEAALWVRSHRLMGGSIQPCSGRSNASAEATLWMERRFVERPLPAILQRVLFPSLVH